MCTFILKVFHRTSLPHTYVGGLPKDSQGTGRVPGDLNTFTGQMKLTSPTARPTGNTALAGLHFHDWVLRCQAQPHGSIL